MIHVIGEILVDTFINDKGTKKIPGGAPFNVACNLVNFNEKVNFYGSVGLDEDGLFLRKYAKKKDFNKLVLIMHKDKPTTKAIVTLSNGERSFHFERNDSADYQLTTYNLKKLDINKDDIVHIGSLMLSEEKGKKFFYKTIKYIKQIGAKISFDINYRPDIFSDKNIAIKTFKKAAKYADYLKISSEELDILSNKKRLETKIKDIARSNQLVFVSMGEQGSLVYKEKILAKVDTVKIKPIDTTGAGDAFYSYVLYELNKGNEDFNYILQRANKVGAMATQKIGAIDVAPKIEEL